MQVIKQNNSFLNNMYNLNNQIMQQNRDKVNRATKQWEIARAERDAVGMANARNTMEGRGVLSQMFGDTKAGGALFGKRYEPYNKQNLPRTSQRQ